MSSRERALQIQDATELSWRLYDAARGGSVEDHGNLVTALADAARALESAHVPYAVIGAFALGLYVAPRATVAVDIAIPTTIDPDVIEANLVSAGFTVRGRYPHSINFRHSSGTPVKLSFDAPLDEMIGRAEVHDIGPARVRVVTRPDLIASKERAARDPRRRKSKAMQDLVDLERLRGHDPDPEEGW
jgi:hypothetical protein